MELLGRLIVLEDRATVGADEVVSTRDDRVEDYIDIECRAESLAHRPERPELPDRTREVLRAGFEFLEEPNVLNGDDGLVGERAEQVDLLDVELTGLGPTDGDRADRAPITQHRHGQHRAKAGHQGRVSDGELSVGQDIRDMCDRTVPNSPRRGTLRPWAHRVCAPNGLGSRHARAVDGADVDPLALEARDQAHFRVAEASGSLYDRV